MVRRPFLIAAAAVVALLAAACGNVASDSGSGAAAAPPPGVTDTEIKIGATLPLTGTAAVSGQGLQAGVQLAVDEINEAGGIEGRKLNAIILDDGYTADRVVTNVRRLVSQEGVYAVVAPAGSQGLPGTWQFIAQNKTPVWGPISPADPKQSEVYLLSATRTSQDQVAIDYFAKQGVKKLAVIQQDNDLGVSAKAALDSQVPKHPGLQIVANETTQAGNTEVSSAVNKVVAAQPDAVLLAEDNTSVALILKALRAQGFTGPVFADQGGAGTGGTSTVGPAGAAAEGFLGRHAGRHRLDEQPRRGALAEPGEGQRQAAGRERLLAADLQLRQGVRRAGQAHGPGHVLRELHQDRRGAEVEPDQAGFHPRHRVRPTARRPHLRRTGRHREVRRRQVDRGAALHGAAVTTAVTI